MTIENWTASEYLLAAILATVVVLLLVTIWAVVRQPNGNGERNWLAERIAGEPVAVTALVATIAGTLVTFGLDISAEQTAGIVAAIIAVATFVARQQVTPVRDPELPGKIIVDETEQVAIEDVA